jgi:mono/diheme cytochrome c family protein
MTVIAKSRLSAARSVAVIVLLVTCAGAGLHAQSAGGAYFLPGDAKLGMQTFFEKGCARCHSVLGEGGRTAPDLARAPGGNLGASELLAGMWNHAPAMWQKMAAEKVVPPKFSVAEMSNLFAFLYSVRSLDEPGDAQRGRQLLADKQCLHCHAVNGQGGHVGPDLKKWASFRNPVSWVQTMWNHAPEMQKAMAGRGLRWPEFKENDVADLVAYVRTTAPAPRGRIYLRPADSNSGRRLFQSKGCAGCHAIGGMGGARGPDLGSRALPRTLGQFAGQMWNHAPAMWASMQVQHIARPQFSNKEMADLIAYLFSERYFESQGNVERGRRTFKEKGCAECHGNSKASVAPDLTKFRGSTAAIPLATAFWNHGPLMLKAMVQQQIPWPRFRPGEISDVMEFLNHRTTATLQGKHP